MEDLTGKTYGRWKVLQLWPERNKEGRVQYLCECSCESHTQRLVIAKSLKSGVSQSCGCLRKERAKQSNTGNVYGQVNAQDLSGKQFGHLTAIERLDSKNKGCWEWRCICDCGEEVISNTRDLNASRKTRCNNCSANAAISKGEETITRLLKDNGLLFETQKTFPSCFFPDTLQQAKFDFYVDNKYLIEFDGEQHFKISATSAWKKREQRIKERDTYKNQWCKENNIPLIRIPYTKLKDLCIEDLMLEASTYII